MYISLYVVVNTFIRGRQPQNKVMRLRTFKKNCSYSTTTLFVALIRTNTLMHSVVSHLCFAFSLTLLHSPAVGKVGKPRWGHPLVEFLIVGKIRRKD